MTDENYQVKNITNQQLKEFYKRYTEYILNFEKHAEKLFKDFVIDAGDRNYLLQKLDNMVQIMMKLYNTNLMKLYENKNFLGENKQDELISIMDETLEMYQKYNEYMGDKIKHDDNFYSKLYDDISIIEKLKQVGNDTNDPFEEIKNELIELSTKYGFSEIDDFLKMYIGNNYFYLLDKSDIETIKIYNKLFVPLSVIIEHKTKKLKSNIVITKIDIDNNSLIDNTCKIIITFPNIQKKIIFEGYIMCDVLNIYIRTSRICSRHLFKVKNEVRSIIKNKHPHISGYFFDKYIKLTNGSYYFIYDVDTFVDKVIDEYNTFMSLSIKNFNLLMKEFVQSDPKNMYLMINLLLMGTDQNIYTAVVLYNLLKDKKVNGEIVSHIIYHHLSYYSQIKLKKISSNIKSELNRIKMLTPDNISVEKKLASLINMPDSVKAYILEKQTEIKSGENNYKIQMAINGLMQFPWKPSNYKSDFENINKMMGKSRDYIQNVANKLDTVVYGHENSKKRLIELVGKWIQCPESTGKVIGLVGPPGVGKTLFAKSISNVLNIPLTIVGLGGMSDSSDLIGHSYTYAGAQYGMIIRQMIKAGNWRCVMFFDEVDKVSKRNETNEIFNTLIHITDPNMNQHFQDRFYSSSIDFDLSGVLIIFSYNDSSKLDPILLDRIDEVKIASYSIQEKITIAQNFLLKELAADIGFNYQKIHFDDSIIRYIIERYTLEAGVRELKRKLEQVLLKLNIDRFYMRGPFRDIMCKEYFKIEQQLFIESDDITDDNKTGITNYVNFKKSKLEENLGSDTLNKIFNFEFDGQIEITEHLIHRYLEKPISISEEIHKNNLVGVINGLYATSLGIGGIVPIQIYKNYLGDVSGGSSMKLKLTGNQKQVMRESVSCALTTAINILSKTNKENIIKKFPYGFHIHAPDGGTPKDGPSAGCAFATAFVSVLLDKKINRYVAMTGEIELTGKVSKIGGLEAKLHGAKKAGVRVVYICEENKEDYEIIKKKSPELFGENFKIKIINHVIDIVTDPQVLIGIEDKDFDKEYVKDHRGSLSNSYTEI